MLVFVLLCINRECVCVCVFKCVSVCVWVCVGAFWAHLLFADMQYINHLST